MDAAPYARVFDLLGHLRELAIGPGDAERRRKRNADVDVIASEEGAQHGLRSSGENAMRGGIVGLRRCDHERLPTRIALEGREVEIRCRANGCYRAPVQALVFLIEAHDL